MSEATYLLELPASIKKAAGEFAAREGVSLSQFIAAAVAEKVGRLRTAREFLRGCMDTMKPKDLLEYLRRAPETAPGVEDHR